MASKELTKQHDKTNNSKPHHGSEKRIFPIRFDVIIYYLTHRIVSFLLFFLVLIHPFYVCTLLMCFFSLFFLHFWTVGISKCIFAIEMIKKTSTVKFCSLTLFGHMVGFAPWNSKEKYDIPVWNRNEIDFTVTSAVSFIKTLFSFNCRALFLAHFLYPSFYCIHCFVYKFFSSFF